MKKLAVTLVIFSTLLLSAQVMARCESRANEAAIEDLSENISNIEGFESADVSFEQKDFSKFKNGNIIKSITSEEMIIESTVVGIIKNEENYKSLSLAHICSVTVLKESCFARAISCKTSFKQ